MQHLKYQIVYRSYRECVDKLSKLIDKMSQLKKKKTIAYAFKTDIAIYVQMYLKIPAFWGHSRIAL